MKLKEDLLLWILTTSLCLCLSCVHWVVNAVCTDHFTRESGEITISLSCLLLQPLGAQQCPSEHTGGCVWRPLSTWNSKLHLVSFWVSHCNRKGSVFCCSCYPFVPFSTTVTVSSSSRCMNQFFRFLPFPKIYISPRHGFTNFSLSAFDERLFAGFLPPYWWLTFLLV